MQRLLVVLSFIASAGLDLRSDRDRRPGGCRSRETGGGCGIIVA